MDEAKTGPEDKSIPPRRRGLTQDELQILNNNGLTAAVGSALLAKSKGVLTAIRGNDSAEAPNPARLLLGASPKEGTLPAKSCTVGPGSSFVAKDHRYSKPTLDAQGILKPTPRKESDFPKEQKTKAAPVYLQQVIAGITSGKYDLISANDGDIEFKLSNAEKKKAPAETQNDIYCITPNPHKGTSPKQVNKAALGIEDKPLLDQPNWWDKDELGEYKPAADLFYPLQYKQLESEHYEDFLIAANEFKGELVPVIGDHDPLLFGFTKDYKDQFSSVPGLNDPIKAMSYNPKEVDKLIDARKKMDIASFEKETGTTFNPIENEDHAQLNKTINAKLDKGSFVKGIITPLESYISDEFNADIRKDIAHIDDFFRHGADARSPYPPSALGTIVFFANDKITECKGPKAIADYLLKEALPHYEFDIHPSWDMNHMGPVVEKQKELGHRVLDDVEKSYQAWKTTKNAATAAGQPAHTPLEPSQNKAEPPPSNGPPANDYEKTQPRRGNIIKRPKDDYSALRSQASDTKANANNSEEAEDTTEDSHKHGLGH